MTGTDEMFDSARETKEEMEVKRERGGEGKDGGRRRSGWEKRKALICHVIGVKMQTIADGKN